MNRTTRWTIACLIAACVFASVAHAKGQDALAAAKDLYGTAAYQEALAMLDRLKSGQVSSDDAFEIDKYRAFCLFAMGKTTDAEQVAAQMFERRPKFQLDEREASPRVVAAFRDVRKRQLPVLVEQAYARGRDAFEQKQADAAAEQFRLVTELAADPDAPTDRQLMKDLQTLATGFLGLVEASKAAQPKPAPADTKPAPPPPPPPRRFYTAADKDVTPPAIVNQEMPLWPSNFRMVQATGILEVVIDEKGQVETVTMRTRIHPVFDALVLERAKTWKYRPATRGGEPVKYVKRVEITTMPGGGTTETKEPQAPARWTGGWAP